MIKEIDFLKECNLEPIHIRYENNLKIIETNEGTFVIKVRKNNKDIYNYLRSHNFNNYILPLTNNNEPYEIYPYIYEEKMITNNDKATSLIYNLSLLHAKTTIYEEINLDKIKEIYENNMKELDNLEKYYHDLHDYIENKEYMSPEEYLLIRNITLIYNSIIFSKEKFKSWYEKKSIMKKERQAFLHMNLSLKNYLITPEHHYFINWDNSTQDIPVYDLLNFIKNDYQLLEIKSLYNLYQSKYQYTEEEKLLFFALISKPWKITFKNNHYNNTLEVQKLLDYITKGSNLVLEEDQKDQEA